MTKQSLDLFEINDKGPLSQQEAELLRLLADDYKPSEAAAALGIAVEDYRPFERAIREKLGASTAPAMIARALAFDVIRFKAITAALFMSILSMSALFSHQDLRRPARPSTQARRQEQLI